MAETVAPEAEWPAISWRLSAPESELLATGFKAEPGDLLTLALKELVARRVLRLAVGERVGLLGRVRAVAVLHPGTGRRAPQAPPLAAVVQLAEQRAGLLLGEGLPVATLARYAVKRRWHVRFKHDVVLGSLIGAGLCRRAERRWVTLGFGPPATLTEQGRQAQRDLFHWLEVGETRFREWVDEDPARALRFAGMAGPGVLVMGGLLPGLERVREHLADRVAQVPAADGGATAWPAGDAGDDGEGEVGWLDAAQLEFAGFGGVDGAFAAIDAGVASGGGDGGGGGGD